MVVVYVLIFFAQAFLLVTVLYDYLFLVAGNALRNEGAGPESCPFTRFAIAIPAHNEQAIIEDRVMHLRQIDYPADRFDIHIVADYCSDATAQTARSAGAIVHERSQGPRGRKGYPLAWLLPRLLSSSSNYDAIVVFDADSRPSLDFLRLMDEALTKKAQVLQGRHVIVNPGTSVFTALADADMRLNNRIRNQAKENLGLSARLMGDAMCFHRTVLEKHPFHTDSLVEDREYGLRLVTQGIRVRFVHNAVSRGQAAVRWSDATGQRLRWYGGVFELQQRFLISLMRAAWRDKSLAALDLALELILPSFSVLVFLAVGLVAIQLALGIGLSSFSFILSSALVIVLFVYPFVGLWAERAPAACFKALLYGPAYVGWRFFLGIVARLRRGRIQWIRTRRVEEEQAEQ